MWQERTPNSQKPEQIQEPCRGVITVCFNWSTFQMGKQHQFPLPTPLWCQNMFQLPETDISTLIPYFMQHFEKLSQTQFFDTLNGYISLQCNALQERLSETVHLYPYLNNYPSCFLIWLQAFDTTRSYTAGRDYCCRAPTCASAITAHTHAHTPGAIGCKNWGSDFAHGLLDSRGKGSTFRLVDDCPASLSFCRHYWATATNLLPSHLAGQHGRITWP